MPGAVTSLVLSMLATSPASAAPRDWVAPFDAPAGEPPPVERCGRIFPGLAVEDGVTGDVAVDGRGFVWATSNEGLVRWDGERARPFVLPDVPPSAIFEFISAHGDVVVATRRDGLLVEVDGDGLRRVEPEPGFTAWGRVLLTDAGLWTLSDGPSPSSPTRLSHRAPDGRWTHTPLPDLPLGIRLLDLEIDADGDGILIATWEAGLWEAHADGRHEQRLSGTVFGLDRFDDGRVVALQHPSPLILHPDGRFEPLIHAPNGEPVGHHGNPRYVVVDGDRVHLANSGHLDTVFPDGSVACTRSAYSRWHIGMVGAVDREGALWAATTEGLARFAAPESLSWTHDTGLSVFGWAALTPGRDRTWIPQFTGRVSRLDREGHSWRLHNLPEARVDQVCVGGGGTWAATVDGAEPRGWLRLDDGSVRMHREAQAGRCFESDGGVVWLAEEDALYEVDSAGVEHGPYASPGVVPMHVLLRANGELIAVEGRRWCSVQVDDLRNGAAWHCGAPPPGISHAVNALAEVDGEIWTGAEGRIAVLRNGAFEAHPELDQMGRPTHVAGRSPRGGVWVTGPRGAARVTSVDGRFRVEEVLTERHGFREPTRSALFEADNGDLWVPNACGITWVPARLRDTPRPEPRLLFTELDVDGQPVRVDALSLPASPPPVTLRYTALSSADPRRVRYRVRMDDGPWSEPADEASLQLVGLGSGTHHLQVAASVAGGPEHPHLSGVAPEVSTAAFVVDVAWPWYRQTWFMALVGLLVAATIAAAWRLALAVQVGLERQRTAIAMDLHDELGAGLGSIRILASLASERQTTPDRQRELTGRIEVMAVELGGALTDIVWSLRPASSTLQALAIHLIERGRDLFAAPGPAFRAIQPEVVPQVRLPLRVSRHAQLVVLEAMRNAARHAHATGVELRVLEVGGRWAFEVTDDGVGIEASGEATRPGGGQGLRSMRDRARAIGADLEIHSGEVGTRVRIVLPRSRRRRR